GAPEALGALLVRIDEPDDVIRQKVLASASRLRLALGAPPVSRAAVLGRIDAELAEHVEVRDAYLAVRPLVVTQLLEEHMVRRLRKGLIRILRLCELAYPREVVASVRAHVFGADAALRANAFEVLESLLDRRLRDRLVAAVELVLDLRAGRVPKPALSPREAYAATGLAGEIASGDPWAAALALDAIATREIVAGGPEALAAVASPEPLVREPAALAVASLRPAGYERALERLLDDPDPTVRAFVRAWDAGGRARSIASELMYSTIEKVLFLQRIPVFSRVAGEDLVGLARGAAVVSFRKGDVIFRQGEPGGAMYFVITGRATLEVDGKPVFDLGPNEVFGELSIFDRGPRATSAVASADAELLRVSSDDFHEAVRETVEIAEAVIQVLNRRLLEADRRLAAAGAPPPATATAAAERRELEARAADETDLE
ncbi:MAG TPA: cyclic nucleotide-binding domain-containing protein, partial [Minicystis sp.]|nr:cyclic nucleotide-binding domain-containing protein [Minicystis sp.]